MNPQDAVIVLVHLANIQMDLNRSRLQVDCSVIDFINEKSLKILKDL